MVVGFEDRVAHWWSCVIAIAAYWMLGDDTQAEQLYDTVENIPKQIASDALVKAIFSAYQCRKMIVVSKNDYDAKLILKSCDDVRKALQESISITECLQSDYKNVVIFYIVFFTKIAYFCNFFKCFYILLFRFNWFNYWLVIGL